MKSNQLTSFASLQVVFYYSEKDPKAIEYVPRIDHMYIEHGLSNKVYRCIDFNREIGTRSQIKLLDNEEDFVDEYIGVTELVVGNFSTIFGLYFSVCLAVVFIFFTKFLFSFFKRKFVVRRALRIRLRKFTALLLRFRV